MIKNIIFFLAAFASLLMADFNPVPYKTTLQEVKNNTAILKDNDIAKGATGIVLHKFDQNHQTIIALATVIAKKEGKLTIKFSKYKNLHQSALPAYKILPKKGDIVILNYLYNRMLPITPNEESYKQVTTKFAGYDLIHPDIFASKLYIEHEPKPTKEDFRQSCLQNDNALLLFAIDNKGYFVDCNSFKVLDSIDLPTGTQKEKHPFYSRIPQIKTRLGGIMGGEDIGDYNRYYKHMLGL